MEISSTMRQDVLPLDVMVKGVPAGEQVVLLRPGSSPSEGLELELWRVPPGGRLAGAANGRESLLVVLGGACSATVGGRTWEGLGGRPDVFSGVAAAVYVPPGVEVEVGSAAGAEVAVVRAPAPDGGEAYVIRPDEVRRETRGRDSWRREVHTILDSDRPARRLLVGETFNEPGGWSSFPPHKHDRHDPPGEVRLQEVYHFRVQPGQGFGIQRLYSPERGIDRALVVEEGDTVLLPFGYHPVVAAPGYRLYYLWALAGEGRELRLREDPAHAWIAAGG
jgi:5-deoxy-glucuronate isomerase